MHNIVNLNSLDYLACDRTWSCYSYNHYQRHRNNFHRTSSRPLCSGNRNPRCRCRGNPRDRPGHRRRGPTETCRSRCCCCRCSGTRSSPWTCRSRCSTIRSRSLGSCACSLPRCFPVRSWRSDAGSGRSSSSSPCCAYGASTSFSSSGSGCPTRCHRSVEHDFCLCGVARVF